MSLRPGQTRSRRAERSWCEPAAIGSFGQIFAFFVIAAEAAEVAVGLAIVLALYRLRRTVRSDDADLLKN